MKFYSPFFFLLSTTFSVLFISLANMNTLLSLDLDIIYCGFEQQVFGL